MKKIKRILIYVELFVFVLCLGLLISSGVKNLQAEQQYEELRKSVTNNEATEIEDVNMEDSEDGIDAVKSDSEWQEAIERRRLFPIDFVKLNETNPDVVGWIRIEGSEVDYPIMCSPTDDTYYLNHNIYGEEFQAGAIYIEKMNDSGFNDSHTVIYGHNQKDQSMFGSLHRYEERSYLQENSSIVIYTENYDFFQQSDRR